MGLFHAHDAIDQSNSALYNTVTERILEGLHPGLAGHTLGLQVHLFSRIVHVLSLHGAAAVINPPMNE
jgi:hypothetical protein